MEAMPGSPLPALAETDLLPTMGRLPLPGLARATCKAVYAQVECFNHNLLLPFFPRWALDKQLSSSASSSGSMRAGAGRRCLWMCKAPSEMLVWAEVSLD